MSCIETVLQLQFWQAVDALGSLSSHEEQHVLLPFVAEDVVGEILGSLLELMHFGTIWRPVAKVIFIRRPIELPLLAHGLLPHLLNVLHLVDPLQLFLRLFIISKLHCKRSAFILKNMLALPLSCFDFLELCIGSVGQLNLVVENLLSSGVNVILVNILDNVLISELLVVVVTIELNVFAPLLQGLLLAEITLDGRVAEFSRFPISMKLFESLRLCLFFLLLPTLQISFILPSLQLASIVCLNCDSIIKFLVVNVCKIIGLLVFDCVICQRLEESLQGSKLCLVHGCLGFDLLTDHLHILKAKCLLLKILQPLLDDQRVDGRLRIRSLVHRHNIRIAALMAVLNSFLLELI